MQAMKALLFDIPSGPIVAADTEPYRGRGNHKSATIQMYADLMDVAINVDCRLPSCTTVQWSRDTANVDICLQKRIRLGNAANINLV